MTRPRPPKKSESLEIRIPYPTKAAFMARCGAEGRSASEVLRGLIETHLAGARDLRRSRGLRLAAGMAIAAAVGAGALPSFARSMTGAEFSRMDSDRNGTISLAEFSRDAAVQMTVKSGGVTRVEMTAAAEGPARARLRALVLRAVFERLDANRDGAVSFSEYRRHEDGLTRGEEAAPAAGGSAKSRV